MRCKRCVSTSHARSELLGGGRGHWKVIEAKESDVEECAFPHSEGVERRTLVHRSLAARANQAQLQSVCGRLEGVDVGRRWGSGYAEARALRNKAPGCLLAAVVDLLLRRAACLRVCVSAKASERYRGRAGAVQSLPATTATDVYTTPLAPRADYREPECFPLSGMVGIPWKCDTGLVVAEATNCPSTVALISRELRRDRCQAALELQFIQFMARRAWLGGDSGATRRARQRRAGVDELLCTYIAPGRPPAPTTTPGSQGTTAPTGTSGDAEHGVHGCVAHQHADARPIHRIPDPVPRTSALARFARAAAASGN
jgi:hypothetical protein